MYQIAKFMKSTKSMTKYDHTIFIKATFDSADLIVMPGMPMWLDYRDQRVPDTRPEPEIFFNTRSVPD